MSSFSLRGAKEAREISFVTSASEGETEGIAVLSTLAAVLKARGGELCKKKKKVREEEKEIKEKEGRRGQGSPDMGRDWGREGCIIVHVNGIIETTCAPYVSPFIYHLPQFSSAPR